jgi:transcriptional regulator with XRE-family HTH domain
MQWTSDIIDDLYRSIGLLVRAARLRKRWNQEDLAEAVGLTRSSIANVEAGRQRLLLHSAIRIADALDVELGVLLPDPEEQLQSQSFSRISPDLTGHSGSTQDFVNATLRRGERIARAEKPS